MRTFKFTRIAWIIWTALFLAGSTVLAEGPQSRVQYHDRYDLDQVGNAKITRTFQFPPAIYAKVKKDYQDPMMLLRSMSSVIDWHEITVVDGRFEDGQCRVVLELFQKGIARTSGPNRWEIKSKSKPGSMELITCLSDRVVFHVADQSEWGPLSATVFVSMCPGSSEVEFDKEQATIRYTAAPEEGTRKVESAIQWKMETTPQLMSSMAKIHSNEEMGMFWTARSVFTNNEDKPVTKFRVRYQLEGFSGWSPWKRSPIVYPGQTVVEAFFPILDIDKLTKLDGSRSASVIAEYQYVNADGETIELADSKNLTVLARNEVIFSRHSDQNAVTWHEANEYLPILVASFCNSNDPVIQQLAGRISGMASGPAASLDSEDAVNYLRAIWQFMEDNKVAYQTSPTLKVNQRFGQHVKYGRDVLSNRAGTCIDLAIFWASAAKAVGLKSFIVIVPGHAFPMVELPNGNRVPIESTLLGKGATIDDAAKKGNEQLEKAMQGPHYIVDVNEMENFGARSIDLERVSEDFFDSLKYKFNPLAAPAAEQKGR